MLEIWYSYLHKGESGGGLHIVYSLTPKIVSQNWIYSQNSHFKIFCAPKAQDFRRPDQKFADVFSYGFFSI